MNIENFFRSFNPEFVASLLIRDYQKALDVISFDELNVSIFLFTRLRYY
jgi:hypothetical protein